MTFMDDLSEHAARETQRCVYHDRLYMRGPHTCQHYWDRGPHDLPDERLRELKVTIISAILMLFCAAALAIVHCVH